MQDGDAPASRPGIRQIVGRWMSDATPRYSLPRTRPIRWLADPGRGVAEDIRVALIGTLFGSVPIFLGGIFTTVGVSALVAGRVRTLPVLIWLGLEVALALVRFAVLAIAWRRARDGRTTPTDLNLCLSLAWAACVGYGACVSMLSGDWVCATLAGFSSAGMVGGMCFRYFAAPRLTAAMITISLGPCIPGALLSHEPLLWFMILELPFYLAAMTGAAYRLNRMLVATMRAERENGFHARHDGLTGLANRTGLLAAAEEIRSRPRHAGGEGVLYLDLDGFKAINDTHGHAVGDRLLQLVAERLRAQLDPSDLAARMGGDEFVVLCEGRRRSDLIALGERLIAGIGAPYACGVAGPVEIGVSVGIAFSPDHGPDVRSLLAAADEALYRSKAIGKGRCTLASRRERDGGNDAGAPLPDAARRSA